MSNKDIPSGFSPDSFLDATSDQPNERRQPLPVENPASSDGLYVAVIGTIKTEAGTIEKGDNAGQPWLAMLIPLKIDVPAQLQESLKLPAQLTFTDRAFIDLTPQRTVDNAPGKNRRQRQYRDALDMNKSGDVWSWRKAEGQVVKVRIKHEMYEGQPNERIETILHR